MILGSDNITPVIRCPRRLAAVAVPALAVALALTLSSCDAAQPGSAATVGDRRISVAQVQSAYQDVVQIVGQDAQVTQGQILSLLIREPFLVSEAAKLGRGVSAQDARLEISSVGSVNVAKLSDAGVDVWRADLANRALLSERPDADIKVTNAAIADDLKAVGVHINPRYGAGIDYANSTILPEKRDWLRKTATPGPSPTP
jgi:hypothetical protein